jgi:cholesterol transport system auxiliary component
MRKELRWLILLLLMGIAGCAVNLNVNKYALNSIGVRSQCCGSCHTILVAEPTVQPGYESDQMIYLECPYELKSFSRNKWIAPPHEMLTSLISQSLRNTCFFRAVVTPPFSGETHYKLETKLMKLQHEFFHCPSRVHLVLHAVLVDTNSHQAIGEHVFDVLVLAPKNNPYGGVLAANKAVKIVLSQLADFVICTIQQNPSLPAPQKYSKTMEAKH